MLGTNEWMDVFHSYRHEYNLMSSCLSLSLVNNRISFWSCGSHFTESWPKSLTYICNIEFLSKSTAREEYSGVNQFSLVHPITRWRRDAHRGERYSIYTSWDGLSLRRLLSHPVTFGLSLWRLVWKISIFCLVQVFFGSHPNATLAKLRWFVII